MATRSARTPARLRIPAIGGTLAYVHDPLGFMRYLYETQGQVAVTSMANSARSVFALGPDACGAVLQNADKAFGSGWNPLVGPFFHRGLMLLDGAEHLHHRRIMQQAFTRPRVEGYAAALVPAARRELSRWPESDRFAAHPALKELTLDLATQIFMGGHRIDDPAELARVNAAFVDCVQAAGALVRRPVPPNRWYRATQGRRVLEEFLRAQLPAARAAGGDDLFSVLTRVEDEDGRRFTDDDVVNHMIFLLMAAHDTSTSTVSSAMYYLGRDQVWQERVREEVLALGPDPTVAELAQLPDLDLVIKESQRLRPPVPLVARTALRDTELLGVAVPAGSMVAVCILLPHHLPDLWTEPDRFDPERFSPARREDRSHRYAWLPFGGGVHKCLGMAFSDLEVRTLLALLLRTFRWSLPPGYVPRMNNVSLPFPKDGLPVALTRLAAVPAVP